MSQHAARGFFDAWNRRAFDEAMTFVADDCHYDDFSFVRPHVGKASVRTLFENVAARAPQVTFRIIDITGDRDVGVSWKLDDRLVWALDAADPGPAHRTNDFHGAPS